MTYPVPVLSTTIRKDGSPSFSGLLDALGEAGLAVWEVAVLSDDDGKVLQIDVEGDEATYRAVLDAEGWTLISLSHDRT